jgi:hypothetical protein
MFFTVSKASLFTFVAASLISQLGHAQSVTYNGYYNGPKVDVNFVSTPPAQYQECREKYINSTAKIFSACSFGVDEARRMAERFGGGKGKTEGYLRGFSWGLYRGVQGGSSDSQAQSVGAALNSDLLGRIDRAVKSGSDQGTAVGRTQGASEARTRFTRALDSNSTPDSRLNSVPEPQFSSRITDPYVEFVGQPLTVQTLLKDPNFDQSSIKVYSSYDSVFLGDVPQFNIWDYYFADGTYRFEMARWVESGAAFQQWVSRPIDTKPQYEALGTDSVIVPVQNPAPGAPATTQQTVDLKEIFKKSFINAYGYYVNYYFSQGFYTNMDEGQRVGETLGRIAGTQYAKNSAEVKAFNQKFRRDEKEAYFNVYNGAYTTAFNETYQDYLNHPKPEIDDFAIIDDVDDGIIQPGERFAVSFKVKNYGGKPSVLTARIDGAENAIDSPSYSIGALKTTVIRTPLIAQMSSNIHSNATVNLLLNVSGSGFNALTVQRSAEVIRQVTPVGIEIEPNVPEGKAIVTVKVRNNSRIPSSSSVRVLLSDSLGRSESQNLGTILAGQNANATFVLSGLNPIDLIKGQGVSVKAQMLLGDLAVDELKGTIFTRSPQTDLPYALAQTAQNRSDQNTALSLMTELSERIRIETDQIERRGYRNHPGDTYLFGALSSYRSRVQSDAAKEIYSKLAEQIWPYRKAFSNFLGIFKSANRKYFEHSCRELHNGRKF